MRGRDTNRIVITEVPEVGTANERFESRHPLLAYVFGDMARGFYVVGCLALDLFLPLQGHASFPSLDPILLPSLGALVLALAYLELRLYRRLWPQSRRRTLEVVEGRSS
jgi:hypothetical protein